MIKVNKLINLAQLDKELNGKGLIAELDQTTKAITAVGLAENNSASIAELESAITRHVAVDPGLAKAALLAKLGITADEAALLLA